jgi:hypothetical protein
MADTGAKKSKKLEEEEELNELDKVGRTSEEIALSHELEEEGSTEEQKVSGEKSDPNVPLTETDLAAGEKQREVMRRSEEQDTQQNLNQWIDTGTHDSTRHGVNWGKNYRVSSKGRGPRKKG